MSARRTREGLVAIGLVLASVLVAGGLCELALWVGGRSFGLQSEWILTNPGIDLDPDLIVIRRHLVSPELVAPATVPIIVTIGDSFTEGFPVARDHAYPAVLARILAGRGVAATVRNAGMGDTGPDQELRLLESRILPKLRPTVVIWQLYANDVWDNVVRAVYRLDGDRLEPVSGADHWIARRQRFFDATPLPSGLKGRSRLFRLLLQTFEPRRRHDLEDAAITPSLAKIARELRAFDALAVTYGFRPYVLLVSPQAAYLPARDSASDRAWYLAAHAQLGTLVRERPDFIDGFLGMAPADRLFDTSRDPGIYGLRHLNEEGYARLALLVARRLLRDGAVSREVRECRS